MTAQVKILEGRYRNATVTNTVFPLVKPLTRGKKGLFVTVRPDGILDTDLDAIRISVPSEDAIELIGSKQEQQRKAETPEEKDRVRMEYKIYREKNLENLLRSMIYLVDSFRNNNILWGVGRGSSVASYILYLIGINRINPLKYDLKIEEFLK